MSGWKMWLVGGLLQVPFLAGGQVYISEFMANDQAVIADEDGDYEDWVEIWNAGTNTADLTGWYLTDNDNNLRKWRFPSFSLTSGARRVVFCSSKDRRNPGANLHTNFKLDNDGEYLALVQADGGTVAHQYAPDYPAQGPNVSYGLAGDPGWTKLLSRTMAARAFVPTTSNTIWFSNPLFDDSLWRDVTQGIGYDTTDVYDGLFGFAGDFQFDLYTKRAAAWLRAKFTVTSTNSITDLRLQAKYDDGLAVWINGKMAYTDNAPADLVWTSVATAARAEGMNNDWTTVPLTGFQTNLINGVNLLAVQVLNLSNSDADALGSVEVEGYVSSGATNTGPAYLYLPTPGQPNAIANSTMGPFVSFVSNSPARPTGFPDGPPLTIYAQASPSLRPVSGVTLYYRYMFSNEFSVGMSAAGTTGVYTAQIPTTNLAPGAMVRWRIAATDVSNKVTTAPAFLDPLQNDQYYGTVAMDYTSNSQVSLVHWFCTNTAQAGSLSGVRCCYYYLGRFYDNVFVNIHGQSTMGFAKKSLNVDFNFDNRFMWAEGEGLEKDINFMSNYADKTRTRNTLAWDMNRRSGAPWFFVFPVRIHLNGSFYGLFEMMEDSDDRWLDRIGMDSEGALYKVYDSLLAVSASEKKTRQWEDKSDLQALINSLDPALPLSTRRLYAYDNIDLARCANYFPTLDIVSSQDHGHKNYFVYRDTFGTGEWMLLPWDEDLSFGHNWVSGPNYFDDTVYMSNSLAIGGGNRLYSLIYNTPEFGQMRLRRLRTLLDNLMMTNGTPTNQLIIEAKMNEILNQIDPPGLETNSDAFLDYRTWHTNNATTNLTGTGGWGFLTNRQSRQEAARLQAVHLPGRRAFLASGIPTVGGYGVPASQPPHMPLSFGDFQVSPSVASQEYFSIVNTNNIYVDISGWSITGAVRHTFKAGTVIPPGGGTNENLGKLYVAKSSRGFRSRGSSPTAGQYCFVQDGYEGQMSARGESLHLVDNTGYPIASLSWTSAPTAVQNFIRVTEIMYNPAPPTLAESNAIPYVLAQDFEYIEVRCINTGTTVAVSGMQLGEGVEWKCGPLTMAPTILTNIPSLPNRAVIVANTNAFRLRYGAGPRIIGVYTGFLDNAGERIQLLDPVGEVVLDFSFNNSWYPATDGKGYSLVIRNEFASWDTWGAKESWRPSGVAGGNPSSSDPGDPGIAPVLVNETLTHTDLPMVDAIELYNPTAFSVNLGGWYLSDDFDEPKKYRFPSNTFLGAHGYLSLDESHFNFPSNAPTAFRLSSTGDDVWLFSADAAGNLTGYAASRSFGAAQNSVSFGRFFNRASEEFFVAQGAVSLGLTNAYPRVGPVVISEIMYHPRDFTSILWTNDNPRDEFIELTSVSGSNTPLFDLAAPTNTWRLRDAVDYDFPVNVTLAPGASLIVVGFDPNDATNLAAFRAAYTNLATNVPVYGPWSGKLDNGDEAIELKRPDAPNSNAVPYILVEQVHYRDATPWPYDADGTGLSLQRIEPAAFGSDPYNWYPASPTPSAPADLPLDSDGDLVPDWAEYRAGSDPLDGLSFLRLLEAGPSATNGLVRWASVPGHTYTVEHTTNLLGSPQFQVLQGGVPAAGGVTAWSDASYTNSPLKAYRIRVEP